MNKLGLSKTKTKNLDVCPGVFLGGGGLITSTYKMEGLGVVQCEMPE